MAARAKVTCRPSSTSFATASCCFAVVSWSTICARWMEATNLSVPESPLDLRLLSIASSDFVYPAIWLPRLWISVFTYVDVCWMTSFASVFAATWAWRGRGLVTLIRTSGVWPSFVSEPATARDVTWPRSFATGMPAARAAWRSAASLWMIVPTVDGFVATLWSWNEPPGESGWPR